jgi:hypothetical protein
LIILIGPASRFRWRLPVASAFGQEKSRPGGNGWVRLPVPGLLFQFEATVPLADGETIALEGSRILNSYHVQENDPRFISSPMAGFLPDVEAPENSGKQNQACDARWKNEAGLAAAD